MSTPVVRGDRCETSAGYTGELTHGIMFHHFHDAKHPRTQGSVSRDEFEAILNFIGIERILSPGEWMDRLQNNRLNKSDVCLTFDDGLLCQFDVALPVLQRYDLKAFWFVYSSVFEGQLERLEVYRCFRSKCFQDIDDFYKLFFSKVSDSEFSQRIREALDPRVIRQQIDTFPFYSANDVQFRLIRDRVLSREDYERVMDEIISERGVSIEDLSKNLWMSDEKLRYLSDSDHFIGLHSYSHPTVLGELPYEVQLAEYQKNYLHLGTVCDRRPVAMSHPCDSYDANTIEILRGLGIRCGFRSNMSAKRRGGEINPSPFEMARQDHANVLRMMQLSGCESADKEQI